jgi:hypothetical protein
VTARGIAAALALSSAVAGCAGGAGHAVPAPQRAGGSAARVAVQFTMHWPSRTSSSRRNPRFVSPSTASVIVEVNPDSATPGPVTFANAPAVAGGTSSVSVDAPVGADVFLISLYDQPQTPGETTTVGNELGRVRVAQTIVADVTNTLGATVIGTVSSLRIGPLPNQGNVVPIAAASPAAYELYGRSPATFTVAPLDAGGNVIVQPDAPPALSLAVNPRALGVLSVTPVNGTSDQFTVQATAPNTTTYPTSVVATARDANGGLATSTTIVDVTSDLYLAYANGGAAAVARYDAHGNPRPLPSGAFAGLTNPVALAYDADDRTIFVADAGLGQVLAFDENGAAVAGFVPRAVAGANGVAYDPHNGNVYASGSAAVSVFAPNGGPPLGGAPNSFAATSPAGIAYAAASFNGPLNRIVVGNASATPKLANFSENGAAQGATALASAPLAVAYGDPVGVNGSPSTRAQLYVTSANGVTALDAFGTLQATTADGGSPFGIAVDPNSRLPQVTERAGNALTSYLDDLSATVASRSFATPAALGFSQPQGVCDVF